ncbi:MAG: tRNA (N6-threonylcarbamoyladenosine(37)-N6)-methyltransferase TrmO [Deltaproteobacteria bacterium]|nr:tRNA (N6-threonylcarbamoyladenosine(37)-N6)-methyltransferase TrmO [Deltaproteobacteria bacterium]
MNDMELRPVGLVLNELKNPSLVARAGDLHWDADGRPQSNMAEQMSEIVIKPEYVELLNGLEDFSHALILYWAHRVEDGGRALTKVHPLGRKDLPRVGVFATCSPARPNPILVIAVKILARKGGSLLVTGLDAIDGSPVLDIKPYLPTYYSVPDADLSAWMKQILDRLQEQVE